MGPIHAMGGLPGVMGPSGGCARWVRVRLCWRRLWNWCLEQLVRVLAMRVLSPCLA